MKSRIVAHPPLFSLLLMLAAPLAGFSADEGPNWPQWRGPNGNGSSSATELPVEWSEEKNIKWKTPLPSWSGSSPIVWGDRIFLTTPTEPEEAQPIGRGRRHPGGQSLVLMCFSRSDGSRLWTRELGRGNALGRKGNSASPSPVTDGATVWAMNGNGDLVAFDFDGREVWRRDLAKDYGKFGLNFIYGSSPLIYQDRLILAVLHGFKTDDDSYLLALDKATGQELWRTVRPTDAMGESPDSYASPQLYEGSGGAEVIMNGGDVVTGHDPISGAELWRAGGLNPKNDKLYRIIASCVVAGDYVFAPTRVEPMLAIRAGGRGDVTETHVLWEGQGPDVPTPVSDGVHLWTVNDRGVYRCYEVATGKLVGGPERIETGTYTSSLIMAEGKIYVTSETAATTVLAAEPTLRTLAVNHLEDGYTLASPAIAGHQIILRTAENLYCIETLDGQN